MRILILGGTRFVLAVMGSMAIEGPITACVADQRNHHTYTDVEVDPACRTAYDDASRLLASLGLAVQPTTALISMFEMLDGSAATVFSAAEREGGRQGSDR